MSIDPIKLAQELIKFQSITPKDCGITDFLIDYLKPHGFECEKLVFAGVTNLYAKFGNEYPNFCFAGHTDVVPAGHSWSLDPFAAIIIDKCLYGRGAVDMKSSIASFIAAAVKFTKDFSFSGSISLMIAGDEEGSATDGTIKILEYLKKKNDLINDCIVGEPTSVNNLGDMIKYGRRGSINFKLIVMGKQGHVAYPENAINSVDILLRILSQLKEIKFESTTDFSASNLEITNLSVDNKASNVIPGEASSSFNIRYNNLHTALELKNLVKQICEQYTKNYILESNSTAQPFVGLKDSKLLLLLKKVIEEKIGIIPQISTTGGTSDARFIKNYTNVIEFGLINKTAHQVDENVKLDDIINLSDIYYSFLKQYFNL